MRTDKTHQRQITGAILGLLVAVLIVFAIIVIVTTLVTVTEVHQAQRNNAAVLAVINDCTDPQGVCFQRGQKETAGAVLDVNKFTKEVVVAAAACASKAPDQTEDQIRACVERELVGG